MEIITIFTRSSSSWLCHIGRVPKYSSGTTCTGWWLNWILSRKSCFALLSLMWRGLPRGWWKWQIRPASRPIRGQQHSERRTYATVKASIQLRVLQVTCQAVETGWRYTCLSQDLIKERWSPALLMFLLTQGQPQESVWHMSEDAHHHKAVAVKLWRLSLSPNTCQLLQGEWQWWQLQTGWSMQWKL